jgi:sulfide:quinone oxidoreductase
MQMPTNPAPLHVTVAGGGFAAAELLLALRALAAERVELELIAPSFELPFRPASTGSAFGRSSVDVYDLRRLANDAGAAIRRDSVEAVAPQAHQLRLASGARADYDVLVVAVGARARSGIAGATVFRDQRDRQHVRGIADALAGGAIGRVAFAVPSGVAWTLPIYELALMLAERCGLPEAVAIVTPEETPLEVFGAPVSQTVADLLAERGVELATGVAPTHVERGAVRLADGAAVPADRVVAVPRLSGRRIAGIPADWSGFVPTGADGGVAGVQDVFAAGDVASFPVKQGGIATQQADVIAATLARRVGIDVRPPPRSYVLRARLLGAGEPLYLQAELDPSGRPLAGARTDAVAHEAPWWPAAKLFGRHLSPWMAQRGLEAVVAA